ncbi:serine hydrolase domain-containing protein [Sphingomonas sp. Root241]|uniref:serine hydrolase domain-containing protein n=1 Tax=Sphingomonas sp. Root241 TaxID=1736501 RepID=UPI00138F59D4|nr:serine hydrolase domain-containing protein [Sphingomonas sp. Root241]
MIDSIAHNAVEKGTVAGLAIGIGDKHGPLFLRGYGFANLETRAPADENSVFRIASITKTFTAAAVMMQKEKGKLRLDQTLADFYPDIPGARDITLRHLLSHTAGLHDYSQGGYPASYGKWSTADEFARGVLEMKPLYDFPPGTRYNYSNGGYVLLAGAIEKASGTTYAKFLKDRIFLPCGMTATEVDAPLDVAVRRADGYSLIDGKPGTFRHADYMDRLPLSAGAIRSSATDMLRWSAAFFGGRVVSPASVAEMTKPATVTGGTLVGDARWWPPGFDPGKPPAFATDDNYGLGWEMTTFYGRPTANHSGGINGFNAMLTHYLDEDLTLVLLGNTDNGVVEPWSGLIQQLGSRRP